MPPNSHQISVINNIAGDEELPSKSNPTSNQSSPSSKKKKKKKKSVFLSKLNEDNQDLGQKSFFA